MLSSAAARSSATLFRRVVADTVSRRFVARHVSTLPSASAAVPSVKDMMIKLTIVDPSGARKQITGLVGKLKKNIYRYVYLKKKNAKRCFISMCS